MSRRARKPAAAPAAAPARAIALLVGRAQSPEEEGGVVAHLTERLNADKTAVKVKPAPSLKADFLLPGKSPRPLVRNGSVAVSPRACASAPLPKRPRGRPGPRTVLLQRSGD